jgi:hypothetical protein
MGRVLEVDVVPNQVQLQEKMRKLFQTVATGCKNFRNGVREFHSF